MSSRGGSPPPVTRRSRCGTARSSSPTSSCINSGARVASSHEILVAVQVDSARLRDRDGDAARALIDATEHVTRGSGGSRGQRPRRAQPQLAWRGSCARRSIRSSRRSSTTMHATEHPSAQPRERRRLAARHRGIVGQLPVRRCPAHDVLDRRLAESRRLADVHERAARTVERDPDRRRHVRAGGAGALRARRGGRGHPGPCRPGTAATVRTIRDRPAAPGRGIRGATRGRARRRSRRGATERLCDGLRTWSG